MHDITTEDGIRAQHRAEFADATKTYGDQFSIPWSVITSIGERTRLRWVAFVEARDGRTDPASRHDKTVRLTAFVKANPDAIVTVETLMQAADCSRGTAHKFIFDNRSAFVKLARGQYRVVDTDAARRAARTSPAAVSEPPLGRAVANVESDIANRLLGAMTGQTDQQPGKP
jgi:hypothetical protein